MRQHEFEVVMQGEGDIVTASVLPDRPGAVLIESIEGDGGRLSLDASKNCVGIAALETLKLLGGQPSCGISLTLKKVIMACMCTGRVTSRQDRLVLTLLCTCSYSFKMHVPNILIMVSKFILRKNMVRTVCARMLHALA